MSGISILGIFFKEVKEGMQDLKVTKKLQLKRSDNIIRNTPSRVTASPVSCRTQGHWLVLVLPFRGFKRKELDC